MDCVSGGLSQAYPSVAEMTGIQFDGKVPVVWIVGMALQTAAFAFWLGQLSTRIDQLETQLDRSQGFSERLVRIEVQLDNIERSLESR